MGKIIPTIQNNFSGGMVTDLRTTDMTVCSLCKHFDNFTKKSSLIPFRDSVTADDATLVQATSQTQNYLVYTASGADTLYALGVASSKAKIFYSADYTSSPPTWFATTGGLDPTNNITDYTLFIEHLGVIFGSNSQGLWSYTITGVGTGTFATAAATFSFNTMTQGLIHSKNGFLYVGYTSNGTINIARRNLSGTWANTALSIPSLKYKIVSLSEYGNYLAIGLAPLQFGSNSQVLLWDRDETLATVSETIDWGNNILYQIDNIDGYLVGVSVQQRLGNLAQYAFGKLILKKYGGGGSVLIKEVPINAPELVSVIGKQKLDNRIYFGFTGRSIGQSTYDYSGIWSIGKNGEFEPFSVQFDRMVNSNTVATTIKGFLFAGDFLFCSFLVGSTYTISKTHGSNFTANSTYDTKIFNLGDSSITKKLIGVTIMTEYLPSGGSVVLKYRVDQNTAWTTIFTNTTANSISQSAIKDASGVNLSEFKEVQFEIISTGNAVITGLTFDSEVIDKRLY